MTLAEVIEIFEGKLDLDDKKGNERWCQALRLGIEALKHYQESSEFAVGRLLPGQTRETEE